MLRERITAFKPFPIRYELLYRNLMESIVERVHREVGSWPGVEAKVYRGGMIFFHVGRREIGHLHGSRMADLPFPVRIREQLVAEGKASLHYLHPKTGWLTFYFKGEGDFEAITELFRLNYERPWLNPAYGAGSMRSTAPAFSSVKT